MTIDCHAHWIPPLLAEALRRRRAAPRIVPTEDGERLFTYQGNRPFDAALSDLEARHSFMRRHRVDTQVLSLAGLFGVDCLPVEESVPLVRGFNDAVIEAQREFPNIFVGLAALPLADVRLACTSWNVPAREVCAGRSCRPTGFAPSLRRRALIRCSKSVNACGLTSSFTPAQSNRYKKCRFATSAETTLGSDTSCLTHRHGCLRQ